jgi:4-amino-4-deoxy-L-arabinose transferase-like glycosyltransferase
MTSRPFSYTQLGAAFLVGLVLRLYFIRHFPFYAGDTKFYDALAQNWLDHGVYGLFVAGQLVPTEMRVPGYPVFLAAIYFLLGRTWRSVMLVQALLDLGTCALIGLIAARLAPAAQRRTVATAALWMAALCPFTAAYTAAILTETLAIFFTALAMFLAVPLLGDSSLDFSADSVASGKLFSFSGRFLLLGFVVGLGTLVRPEAPLLLAAVGAALCWQWTQRVNWKKLILAACCMCVGLLLPLFPWAARNARTLGRAQFLAPHYAETYGDFVPRGFYSWTRTWMTRRRDAYLVTWKVGKAPIAVETLPANAFDSDQERGRVADLLAAYNGGLRMTPSLDYRFAILARERTARRPWRTYIFVPAARILAMWFAPRIETLPYSGALWPPAEKWRDNRADFGVTLGFWLLGFLYVALAIRGLSRWPGGTAGAFLIVYVVLRSIAMTPLPTVEPRYVMECFPVVLAFGALAWAVRAPQEAPGHESVGLMSGVAG